jgi:hypothetical protein
LRILKASEFSEWAEDERLADKKLAKAAEEVNKGLFEANLGGGLYKKRVALPGKGKSGGARTLIAFKKDKLVVFIYAFKKGKRANISEHEEEILKGLADKYLRYSEREIDLAIAGGMLVEVEDE